MKESLSFEMGEALEKYIKQTIEPCYLCDHVIDLDDHYVRVATLESVTKGKPEAYAHELCAAEAEVQYMEDQAHEDYMDWLDELEDEDA